VQDGVYDAFTKRLEPPCRVWAATCSRSSEQMICAIHPTPAPAITAARSCAGTDTERRAIAHAGPAAATAIGFVQRSASRSGRISAMPIRPTTSMMMPQIMKPVLKPASGVAAVSTTLPMM